LPNSIIAKPRVYTGAPKKVHTEVTPAVLPLGPQPIPVTWFARLVNALHDRDQAGAKHARRELRSRGYDVRPIGTSKRGGPAR
jgi:hypothetical protein